MNKKLNFIEMADAMAKLIAEQGEEGVVILCAIGAGDETGKREVCTLVGGAPFNNSIYGDMMIALGGKIYSEGFNSIQVGGYERDEDGVRPTGMDTLQ